MRTLKRQEALKRELVDNYVEGYISRDVFEMGVEGMTESQRDNILFTRAIEYWGRVAQVDMAIEEMAELTQALCKSKRRTKSADWLYNVYDEIADVEIMIAQLKIIYGDTSEIAIRKAQKLERLEKRLDSSKEADK